MASIKLNNLTMRYGNSTAVNGINLAIDDGEFVVFLGPSGCGKTTTLRCIAGLENPTSGDILFDGVKVNHLHASARNVAMVFQFISLYPHKTVRKNIAFPLRARGLSEAQIVEKIKWVEDVFSLSEVMDRYPNSLPPGSRQLAALARAVVRDPKVLLLDEPLSAIDEQFREEMRWELKHLQSRLGVTTIHVTHDQREAMSLADRIVLMHSGDVVQIGTPQALFNDPINEFAAHFIGSPAMNLADVQVASGGLMLGSSLLPLGSLPTPLSEPGNLRLGIRPNHVQRDGRAGEPGCVLALIEDRYAIGREEYFQFSFGGQKFVGIDKEKNRQLAEVGTSEMIRFDCAEMRFFTPDGIKVVAP
jgi:ABC-type sugar transport system ATPase subunit